MALGLNTMASLRQVKDDGERMADGLEMEVSNHQTLEVLKTRGARNDMNAVFDGMKLVINIVPLSTFAWEKI